LRSDGYNWINCASAYASRLSYSVPPIITPYDIGYSYSTTQTTILTTQTINTYQQLSSIPNVISGIYIANVLHAMTTSAVAVIISAGFGNTTSANNYHETSFTTAATASTFPLNVNSIISVSGTSIIYFNYKHSVISVVTTPTNGNRSLLTLTRIG